MNSVVFIKQVAQVYLLSGIDMRTKEMIKEGLVHTINPYDEVALERAIRLREEAGAGQVTVVTLGANRSEQVLRWGLAMGADQAIHILDSEEIFKDPLQVAAILAEAVRELNYDALFFGKMALDDQFGLVGTYVAELLELPLVTALADFQVVDSGQKALVQRALERGNREEVECPLPAVFTADMALARPRYPSVPGRKRAAKAALTCLVAAPLLKRSPLGSQGPRMVVQGMAPPKIRPKKILAPDSNMSAASRMQFVMAGGAAKKGGDKIGGDSDQTAKSIFDYLIENKYLPEPESQEETPG